MNRDATLALPWVLPIPFILCIRAGLDLGTAALLQLYMWIPIMFYFWGWRRAKKAELEKLKTMGIHFYKAAENLSLGQPVVFNPDGTVSGLHEDNKKHKY